MMDSLVEEKIIQAIGILEEDVLITKGDALFLGTPQTELIVR